jgi:hypothetical protein
MSSGGKSMSISERERIILILTQQAQDIIHTTKINELIMIHELMLKTFYSKKPLFYKMIFKYSRLSCIASIFSIYYSKPQATLKDVKDFIHSQNKPISINTLNSLLIQLRVSGRLDVFRNPNNKRESLYQPSLKVIEEIYELIQTMLKPYQILHRKAAIQPETRAEEMVPLFFSRYSHIVCNHITIPELLPESELFIDKDAGHMIMLILYKEYIQQNSTRIMLSHKKIAAYSFVSRTHVCSLLREAQAAGLISLENNLFIELSENFIKLFQEYFSLYLAQILYCVEKE